MSFLSGSWRFFLAVVFLVNGAAFPVLAQTPDVAPKAETVRPYEEIQVLVGDLQKIPTTNLRRVSITDPTVADINEARGTGIEVIGLTPGQTVLFIWEDSGKRTVVIRVNKEDLALVQRRIAGLLDNARISGLTLKENKLEGKVVISGTLPEEKMEAYKGIITSFGDRIMNLVQQGKMQDMVQIDVQLTELNTTLQKTLGVNWTTSDALQSIYHEKAHTDAVRGVGDLFKIAGFTRNAALVATVDMLVTQGKATVLSKPRIVVISGKAATFSVGGQVPMRSSVISNINTGSSSLVTTTYTLKDYGITVTITPTIENTTLVNMPLTISVTEIDESVPATDGQSAFLTRSANTMIVLKDRQTIVMAGMIKRRNKETFKKVAIIGDIPFIGAFFRSKNTGPSENELVISLTPTILRANNGKNNIEESISDQLKAPDAISSGTAAKAIDALDRMTDVGAGATGSGVDVPAKTMMQGNAVAAPDKRPAAVTDEGKVSSKTAPEPVEKEPGKAVKPAGNTAAKPGNAGQMNVNTTATAGQTSVPKASKAPKTETRESRELSQAYGLNIQKKILSAISFPYQAQVKNWQGTVKLALVVYRDGTLKSVLVKESSGHEIFDQDAVNTAQILAPYAAFPVGIDVDEITLSVPVVYSLDGFLENVTRSN